MDDPGRPPARVSGGLPLERGRTLRNGRVGVRRASKRAKEGKAGRPTPVGDVVAGLLDRLQIVERVERASAIANWDSLVGEHISRVARPLRFDETTLFVEVSSAAWLMELNMMRNRILARLNAGKREGRIERIVFVQAGGRRGQGGVATGQRRE